MTFKSHFVTNEAQTDVFVSKLAELIKPQTIILLNGDIGTGKTYVSSKIANHFGINNLSSASFQRVNLHVGDINMVHCDFYRKTCDYDFFCNEIEPLLLDPWILLMEWTSFECVIPEVGQIMELFINHKGGSKREIRITHY
jgi:tRNA threonylcarbamoyladenosine biosynthesis protein TsaE